MYENVYSNTCDSVYDTRWGVRTSGLDELSKSHRTIYLTLTWSTNKVIEQKIWEVEDVDFVVLKDGSFI